MKCECGWPYRSSCEYCGEVYPTDTPLQRAYELGFLRGTEHTAAQVEPPAPTITHPGGTLDEGAFAKGFKRGHAAAWRAIEHVPGAAAAECRRRIAQMGSAELETALRRAKPVSIMETPNP